MGTFFIGHPEEPANFVGHGAGLEPDELRILPPRFRTPIRQGKAVAHEPKFLSPGRGAVGIENTFAVTEMGCEILTGLTDDRVCR